MLSKYILYIYIVLHLSISQKSLIYPGRYENVKYHQKG